jgi:hypothetical protein
MTDELPMSVAECHDLIRHLQEENTHLRRAGSVFGQLAERLNQELRLERALYASDPARHGQTDDAWQTSRDG